MDRKEFNIYRFKERLQYTVGDEHLDYVSVEAVGDACKKMLDAGVDSYDAGIVLLHAALKLVLAGETFEEFRHFGEYVEAAGKRAIRLADDSIADLDRKT